MALLKTNTGIGTINPTSALHVVGDGLITGVVTATSFNGSINSALGSITNLSSTNATLTNINSSGISTLGVTSVTNLTSQNIINSGVVTAVNGFVGNLTGTATTATKLETPRIFEITGDIVASPISFNGTSNVSLAATIQPNSVGLGTDTFGEYVETISGTVGEIVVTGGTGERSTPVISFDTNPTIGGNVTIGNDLQVNNNLNVNGNITIGGTSAFLIAEDFRVADADIILGFTTDFQGNDVSNDTTANHGGIAIASTEGSPLIELVNVAIGESLPATYKKFMWFKAGSFTGLNTDAWLSNYAIGIGSTQFPSGTRLAAGSVQFTENDLAVVRDINASGIVTSIGGFVGNLTGTASTASFATTAFNLNGVIEADLRVAFAQTSNISSYSVSAGVATNLKGGITGNVPYQLAADTTTFVTNGSPGQVLLFNGSVPIWGNVSAASGAFGGITVYDEGNLVGTSSSITALNFVSPNLTVTASSGANGIATITMSDNVTVSSLNVSGISSLGIVGASQLTVSGISTFNENVFVGSGITMYAATGIISATAFYGSGRNLIDVISQKIEGIQVQEEGINVGSATSFATLNFIGDYVTATGIGTVANITFTTPPYSDASGISSYASLSGIATYADNAGIATYANNAGVSTYADNAGISTYASSAGIATYADNAGIATYSTLAGIATYADNAGIATYANYAPLSGIATYADSSGIATYASSAGIATYADNAGIAIYASSAGIATYASSAGIATYADNAGVSTVANYSLVAGISTYASSAGIATYANNAGVATVATYALVAGIATVATYSDNAGVSTVATYASLAGIATYADNAGVSTVANYALVAGIATVATYSDNAGVSTVATYANSAGVSTNVVGGVASVTSLFVSSGISTLGVTGVTDLTAQNINASGVVTATTFVGNLTGTATTATNINISASSTGDTTTHIVLVGDNTTGGQQPFIDNGSLTYNGSTNTLTAGAFNGDGSLLTSLNASQLTSGTIPGDRGVTSGSTSSSFVEYNGTTKTAGQFDGGTTNPDATTRLNYNGYFYATRFYGDFYGDGSNLTNISISYSPTAGIATYADNAGISTNVIGGIGSISQLQVTGISTFTSGPVLIGAATQTGTPSQPLQVTGGAYISGNVGLGTVSPATRLHLHAPGEDLSVFRLSGSAVNAVTYDLRQGIFGVNNGGFSIRDITNFRDRFVITPTGNIGINTNNPQAQLSIGSGSLSDTNIPIQISTQSASGLAYYGANNNGSYGALFGYDRSSYGGGVIRVTGGNDSIDFVVNNTTLAARLNSSGNLGIGITNPTSRLHVVGDANIVGVVTAIDFNSTSDQKLKENIKTVENSLEIVSQLRGVSFDWKENGKPSYGVIAQELEQILPELVSDTDTKTVNYNGIIAILIESIKELKSEIEDLKKL